MLDSDPVFRALAHGTRRHALLLLRHEGRLCVCEIVHALAGPQARISRHLAQLRDLGLVRDERHGQWVHYRLHPELPAWVLAVLDAAAEAEAGAVETARARLSRMPERPPAVAAS